ncbi:hypothetical protein ACQEUU_02170 [Nonomuraea sp. CA-218870]|uniref:hypothetical protein n=1 Tax=Nonomuraea sp. CA-218870 TaxID=3239998 RepID=UPI003D8BF02C
MSTSTPTITTTPAKSFKTLLKAAFCTAAAATALVAGGTTAASADSLSALGCQTTSARLTSTSGNTYSWNCSGAHYISVSAQKFQAGGWSGAVYLADGRVIWFCDFDTKYLNGARTTEVYLNATKPARCP